MLWTKNIELDLTSYSAHHMDANFRLAKNSEWVRITGIYGLADVEQRHRTWNLIRHLQRGPNIPWFLGGDFNEILNLSEKQGGSDSCFETDDRF